MNISSGLHKSYESIAHIGNKCGPQVVLDIQMLYQLENLDLPDNRNPSTATD